MNIDIYEAVTASITAALKRGVVPWRKPWHTNAKPPANGVTDRRYRGVNTVLLSVSPYMDHRWVTFNQANQLGGKVKAGEKATTIVFWKQWEFEEPDPITGELVKKRMPILKTIPVFNVMQCDGLSIAPLEVDQETPEPVRIDRAESIVKLMPDPPTVEERGKAAWYRVKDDLVQMPPLRTFRSGDGYYGTLFHELSHSTGHERRLNRPAVVTGSKFGSGEYGHEELVAELGSSFVCAVAGLDNSFIEDAANYVDSWLTVLKGNPKTVVIAAAQAQRAADFIFGVQRLA